MENMRVYIISIYDADGKVLETYEETATDKTSAIEIFKLKMTASGLKRPAGAKSIGAKLAPSDKQWAELDITD